MVGDIAMARRLLASGEARQARVVAGLTIDEVLAEVPDERRPSRASVSRWERGLHRPNQLHAEAFAQALSRTIRAAAAVQKVGRSS